MLAMSDSSDTDGSGQEKKGRVKPNVSIQADLIEEARLRALTLLIGGDRTFAVKLLMKLGADVVLREQNRNWLKVEWPHVPGEERFLEVVQAQFPKAAAQEAREAEKAGKLLQLPPMDASPGVTKLANELRSQAPSPDEPTRLDPGLRKDGTPRRRKGQRAKGGGPDTPAEKREREGR